MLPQFNPSGTGPQGAGAIPPEALREGLRATGTDLPGSTLQPEEYPGAQAVMDRQVDAVMDQLGMGNPSAAAPSGSPNGDTPSAPATAPQAPGQMPGTAPAGPGTVDPRVRGIFDKYRGDVNLILQGYQSMQGEATRVSQRNSELEGQLAGMNETLMTLSQRIEAMSQQPPPQQQWGSQPQPRPERQPYTQAGQAPAGRQPGNGLSNDFLLNPEPLIENVVGRVVQREILNYAQAQAKQREMERAEDLMAEKQAELERLRPTVQRLYSQRRSWYDQLPPDQRIEELLSRAQTEEKLQTLTGFVSELQTNGYLDLGPRTPTVPPGASPGISGAGTMRQAGGGPEAGPAAGGWSKTRAMQDLWHAPDGASREMDAMTRVLKERGFGENVPIY